MNDVAAPSFDKNEISRVPGYLDASPVPVFHWRHRPRADHCRDITVIICSPMGFEYTHSHRTLKYLADRLAESGFPAFRFDFHGVGDSPGDELASNNLQLWEGNLCTVIDTAKAAYPENKVCLLGVRFGATLACLATSSRAVDYLVLWEPVIKGRQYVREMTALSRFSADTDDQKLSYIESAGFLMSGDTAEQIKKVNLTGQPIDVSRGVLYLNRNDVSADTVLVDQLRDSGIDVTQMDDAGYAGMMAEPQDTVIPEATIAGIIDWLLQCSQQVNSQLHPVDQERDSVRFDMDGESLLALTETCCWYDENKQLFGILCSPAERQPDKRQAVLLLNSGSVHHVGPNRVYTHLARKLASSGVSCLRIDIEGLGDSCQLDSPNKNHPYQRNAVSNALAAVRFLCDSNVADEIIVAGLCSGAYAAFHAGREISRQQWPIKEVVLINPLTFYWQDGMSLDIPSSYQTVKDSMQYSQSVRSLESWKKLLSGKASLGYIFKFVFRVIFKRIKDIARSCMEICFGVRSRLANDLLQIQKKGVRINFVFSSTDPGLNIVRTEAGRVFKKGLMSNAVDLKVIEGADHTFSKLSKRELLYQCLTDKFS